MRALAVLAVILGLTAPAAAQEPQDRVQPTPADAVVIDATKLGVSLSRIQRGLRTAEAREKSNNPGGLRLEYNVQVYGTAPRIDVIQDGEDLVFGPVPGTAPSHSQFIEFVTPQIYRTPAMPISAFAAWAAKWMADKSKKSRCEEEIANYRALVMQGVNVSAPRCTQ
jgi:hypothetical protein